MCFSHALSVAAGPPLEPPCEHDFVLRARTAAHARQAHAQAEARGLLRRHLPTCSALVLAYAALLGPASARRLFDSSPLRTRAAFLSNALLRALSKLGLQDDAFGVYNAMLRDGVRPDDRTYPFVLKACADAGAAHKGREAHCSSLKLGFNADVFVGNTLLSFYGECAAVADSVKVFDEMPQRDIVSWNSIISVFSANGFFSDSMDSFLELMRAGIPINSVSLVSTLPACAALQDEVFGRGVHGIALKIGLDSQVSVGNTFVDMYGKCGDLDSSMQVFRCMSERNDVSWNSIIGTLVHVGQFGGAVGMFKGMVADELKPNSVTMSSLLPALVELGLFGLGREVHGYSLRTNMDSDVFVANSLIDMYAKSGCLKKASHVFFGTRSKNVVSWNAMIANLTQNGAEFEAIRLVRDMQVSGQSPNSVTFTNVLPACARIASLRKGKEIHARSIRDESCNDLFVSNALIDMYAKCGRLDLARNVFDISDRDQVSYNTLIVGYSESMWSSESLDLFLEMRRSGHDYDLVSFMGAISACANLSKLKQGKEIHASSVRKMFYTHLFVANALLDLYVKLGKLNHARKIFDRTVNKDVASWNSMILGYAMQCEFENAIDLFDMMKYDNSVEYDHVSYVAVLSACSHGGMVERGKKYFDQMLEQNIKPTQMHYACMVDMLGRAGLMKEAEDLITRMPFEADSNVWGALLGACRLHGNIELARWAAEHLFVLRPEHSGYYALLSNMYAEAGRWEETKEIRELMKSRKVKKNPGCSWVEAENKIRAFVVGERTEASVTHLCEGDPG